ncbi:MAG TPA: CBS domain-containing protein [Planctomycetota bacterium]
MTSPAVTLPSDTRVVDALELMAVRKIRRVPVLEKGRLVGILATSDLQSVLGPDDSSPRRAATLGDIMKRGVVTVRPDDRLDHAAWLMVEHEVSGLPVVDDGRVVGLITESDIFAAFTRLMEGLRAAARR